MLEFDFELELDIRLGADNGNDSSNDVSHNPNEQNFGKSSRQFGNLHNFDDFGDFNNFSGYKNLPLLIECQYPVSGAYV